MKLTRRTLAISFLAGAMLMAGCSPASKTTEVGGSQDSDHVLTVAVVPGQDIGLIYVPEVQEIFKDHGVRLAVTEIGGAEAVESVVSGGYDLAYSGYVPQILGLAEGEDLKVISGLSNLGPAGNNGSLFVREDSGIESWADLADKSVATASKTSISSLALQAAIYRAGDKTPNLANLVVTSPSESAVALANRDVDATDLVEPYASAALVKFREGFVNIGDAKHHVFGENAPLTAFFTTTGHAKEKEATFTAFREALDEAVAFGNKNAHLVKMGGARQAGLPEDVALMLPTSVFGSSATAEELKPIVDVMLEMGWIDTAPNLEDFAAG